MSRYYTEGTIDRIIINSDSGSESKVQLQFSLEPSEKFCFEEDDKKWIFFIKEEETDIKEEEETDNQREVSGCLLEGTKFIFKDVDGLLLLGLRRDRQHIRVYVTDPKPQVNSPLSAIGLEVRD